MQHPTHHKPLLVLALASLLAALPASAAVIFHDAFDEPVGIPPVNWPAMETATEAARQHALIEAGSLGYAGLLAPTGNSLGLGNKTEDYAADFSLTTPGAGQSLYLSFVMTINTMTQNFGNQFAGSFQLQKNTGTPTYLSIGLGTTDFLSGTFGFSVSGNNRGYNHADSVTGPNAFATGVNHLVVAEYKSAGTVNLWVNPDSATFGTDTPPTTYLTDPGTANAVDFGRLRIYNNGSGGLPSDWALDEVRIGTTWAEVTPAAVPEPATLALLLGFGALGLALWRRR